MNNNLEVMEKVKNQMRKQQSILSDFATKYSCAIRLKEEKKDIRLDFARDIDRIIHSLAYTRYLDKTQVYSDSDNFDISKRMTHVQFVSRASKTIARSLGLNEDLCEAIALGHDVGHAPFGHFGESVLNNISKERTGRCFAHNLNSVRILEYVEKNGKGLNLTLQVLDGIMCHNGEFIRAKYAPIKKNKAFFINEYNECLNDERKIKKLVPMTLEGCVVRISDVIGYIGKDIDDAKNMEVFDISTIPSSVRNVLGTKNVDIMNNIILDVIEQSYGKGYIQMSEEVFEQVDILKKFNYENIYKKALNKSQEKYIKTMFNKLYDLYLLALQKEEKVISIYDNFLLKMSDEYIKNTTNEEKVLDYIAMMTDTSLEKEYLKYYS